MAGGAGHPDPCDYGAPFARQMRPNGNQLQTLETIVHMYGLSETYFSTDNFLPLSKI